MPGGATVDRPAAVVGRRDAECTSESLPFHLEGTTGALPDGQFGDRVRLTSRASPHRSSASRRHDDAYNPTRRHTTRSEFDVSTLTTLPKVDIAYSYIQPSPAVYKALVADGVRGIVLAGTGAGLVSSGELEALKAVLTGPEASRPVIVRSNRTGNGRVVGVEALAPVDGSPNR